MGISEADLRHETTYSCEDMLGSLCVQHNRPKTSAKSGCARRDSDVQLAQEVVFVPGRHARRVLCLPLGNAGAHGTIVLNHHHLFSRTRTSD